MEKQTVNKILLFVSKDSVYYLTTMDDFKNMINALGEIGKKFQIEIVDISQNPQLADQYNIVVTPTLLVGDQRFLGQVANPAVANFLKSYFSRQGD